MTRFRTALEEGLKELRLSVTEAQADQLARFAALVEEGNRQQNLTRITSPEEMAVKHFVDSLSLFLVDLPHSGARFLDVGTGAGFPGIPLAICRPQWDVVLLDSLRKRLAFLESAMNVLGLNNVSTLHARAEDAARNPAYRDSFDVVVSRAVARLPVLLELCLPFVKVGGVFVAMKGSGVEDEVEESGNALAELNGRVRSTIELSLPAGYGQRTLVVVEKTGRTKQMFPRRAGIPAKQPL
jgi:16S rRNA (guanine527-N7)-methyltransferase